MRYLHEAGWPVWFVLALAIPSLWYAIRHAIAPERKVLIAIVGLSAASLLMALLGTALGLDATINGIREVEPEQRWIFLIGLQESMRNIELALLFAVPTAVLATVGAVRMRKRLDEIENRQSADHQR